MSFLWSRISLSSPADAMVARSSHGVSVVGDHIVVYGGEHEARVPIDSAIWSAPVSGGEWHKVSVLGSPPIERIAHAQIADSENIWIFGGRQGVLMNEAPLNDFHRFHVPSAMWHCIASTGDVPSPRSFHKMTLSSCGQTAFVFGGCGNDGRTSDLFKVELATGHWTRLCGNAPDIAGRGGATFFSTATHLYLVAGFCGHEMSDVHVFDLARGAWTVASTDGAFRARSVAAGGILTHPATGQLHVVVFGGELAPSAKGHEGAGNFGNDLVLLPLNSDGSVAVADIVSLAPLPGAPEPRGWTDMGVTHVAAASAGPNALVVYGGLAGSDEMPRRLADTFLLTWTN